MDIRGVIVSEGPEPGLFKGTFRTALFLPTFLSAIVFLLQPFPPHRSPSTLPVLFLPTPSHPFRLPLPAPPPLIQLGLGSAVSSLSGSGRSPTTKRLVVHFELKRVLLVKSFLQNKLLFCKTKSIFDTKPKHQQNCEVQVNDLN